MECRAVKKYVFELQLELDCTGDPFGESDLDVTTPVKKKRKRKQYPSF